MAKETKPKDKAPEEQGKTAGYFVTYPFNDIKDFSKSYNVGDDVSHFDKDRLDHLVKNNLVEVK